MNVKEIRERRFSAVAVGADMVWVKNAIEIFQELTAQFAEANEHLAKIANPTMVVNAESPWVTFKTYDGRNFSISRDAVASVLEQTNDVTKPKCVIETFGSGAAIVSGSYKEVCKKLKIPTEEGR